MKDINQVQAEIKAMILANLDKVEIISIEINNEFVEVIPDKFSVLMWKRFELTGNSTIVIKTRKP